MTISSGNYKKKVFRENDILKSDILSSPLPASFKPSTFISQPFVNLTSAVTRNSTLGGSSYRPSAR